MENLRHGLKVLLKLINGVKKNLFVYSGSWAPPYFTTFFTILLQNGYQPEFLVRKHYFT